ncbi:DUF5330 domain-containing protein [Rhizobium oryzicola]|uniref:DUF5330 domain-containing protein n=1 Tax=Rhizobium oryzicola TaxID=1232668 RepID=A0ABT8SSY1_9HYPH|nr:DUF5330 domain-containing protein [Rhizobium oryzicola]MDO1581501.1 DUF5330 domain-containing protein [Rhizobium oryzicola]
MWFLIKGSVFFAMVLVVLSYFSSQPTPAPAGTKDLQVSDAISAATEAYGYIASICKQKPDVCEKGGEAFTALSYRAREGARVAFEFLDNQLAGDKADGKVDNKAKLADANPAPRHLAEAPAQPMPPKPQDVKVSDADAVKTGTVVPLPMKRPATN